jgi:serine acetyltransferase
VVTQDVEPGWKVAGCPARRIESTVHSHPQGR